MSERASLQELLDFANKVRAAGGGNPLDALMPATPLDTQKCLIAKNLNFNCEVKGAGDSKILAGAIDEDDAVCEWLKSDKADDNNWSMFIDEKETRDKIADALNLLAFDSSEGKYDCTTCEEYQKQWFCIVLPEDIGQVASDFDDFFRKIRDESEKGNTEIDFTDSEKELLPYIEASFLEAESIGTIIDGKLVL
jgi:hypothetical protein